MKALILVGGYGTRLRPLTFSCPKPIVELCNKPIVVHQIEALAKVGVTDIVLAVGFQPNEMIEPLKQFEKKYNVKITCSIEKEPLGTAGPIRLAKELLTKDNKEQLCFVFNSDIVSEFPLQDLINFQKKHGGEGTLFLTKVSDPSKYGVILSDENGKIKSFIEKPQQFISDRINAGLYIFNTKMIDRIPENQFSMLEKDTFPQMAKDGVLYSLDLPGFWMDVGQPKDFLQGTQFLLDYYKKINSEDLKKGEGIVGNVLIDQSAKVSNTAIIGPNVTIGPDCVIEDGITISNVLDFRIVCCQKMLRQRHIHGFKTPLLVGIVQQENGVDGLTVLGEDVQIKDEIFINGAFVLPHKAVSATILEKDKIIM